MPVGRSGGEHGRRKNIFSALSLHAINPTTPTQGHFVLSPVSVASRDQDDGPVELNDRHLRSHGKIGDCEQSIIKCTTYIVERVLEQLYI